MFLPGELAPESEHVPEVLGGRLNRFVASECAPALGGFDRRVYVRGCLTQRHEFHHVRQGHERELPEGEQADQPGDDAAGRGRARSRDRPFNPPAAEDSGAVVERDRLAPGVTAGDCGSVKVTLAPPSLVAVTTAGLPGLVVADLRRTFQGITDRRFDQPVESAEASKPRLQQIFGIADNHFPRFGHDFQHEPFLPGRNARASALRWPMVKRSKPSCSPRIVPSFSRITPARSLASAGRRFRTTSV